MRIKSVQWGPPDDPSRSITIGEFEEDAGYRTIRKTGTPNCLMILTLGGGGRMESEAGELWESQAGDILLYEPGAYHNYGTSPVVGTWSLLWSHFVPPAGWDYWSGWPPRWAGLRSFRIDPLTTNRVCDSLRLVHDAEFATDALWGSFMLNCLERAWLFIRQVQERQGPAGRDKRIQLALHHVQTHLARKLSIEALARRSGMSVSRFAHLFKDETGTTPQQYIESRRMELAGNLLRYSNLTVAEVARACGFEDPFYFSSRFKRHFALSPRAYR